jgi:hypothetical protein
LLRLERTVLIGSRDSPRVPAGSLTWDVR